MVTKREKLVKLRERALADLSLPLREGATKLVFGAGNPEAEILMIGEGPGRWEDEKGIPFVGNAGFLLNQLLQLIEVVREDVFITNMVMYRPPNNRDPLPEELAAFKPYLNKIIEIIQPKIVVTLGRFSMAKFIPNVFISSVHGKPKKIRFQKKDLMVIPMYHPAAGLRNGAIKERLKEDFLKMGDLLKDLKTGLKNQKLVETEIEEPASMENKSKQMSLI